MLFIYMVGDNCRIPGRSAPLNPMYFSLSQHRWRRPSDEMRQLLMFISSACSLKTLFCKWARKASLICGRGNSIMITTQEYKTISSRISYLRIRNIQLPECQQSHGQSTTIANVLAMRHVQHFQLLTVFPDIEYQSIRYPNQVRHIQCP